jgi:phosphocarrier protein HPr
MPFPQAFRAVMKFRSAKEEVLVRREIVILNELGLHARPAAEFVRHANRFRSDIWLIKDDVRYSAESLIEIMRANLNCGTAAILEAKGVDAEAAVERLAQLLHHFREQEERSA